MFDSQGYLLLIAVVLELLLIANYSFKHVEPIKMGLNKIGLDGAILGFMVFVSLYFGLLITSDLPGWINTNSIQATVNFTLVTQNFVTFLSISIQMFCLFFCGFIRRKQNRLVLSRVYSYLLMEVSAL